MQRSSSAGRRQKAFPPHGEFLLPSCGAKTYSPVVNFLFLLHTALIAENTFIGILDMHVICRPYSIIQKHFEISKRHLLVGHAKVTKERIRVQHNFVDIKYF